MRDNNSYGYNLENRNTMNYNGTASKSKSPHKSINGIRLYNFSQINSYKNINKPHLNQKEIKSLNMKLNLNKLSQNRYEQRIKNNKLYLNFEHNPFSKNDKHHMSQHKLSMKTQRQLVTILDALNSKKQQKKTIQQERIIGPFKKMRKEYQNMSKSNMKNIHSKSAIKFSNTTDKKYNDSCQKITKKAQNINIFFNDQLQFDDILKIKQQRFFTRRKQELNLFKVLFDKDYMNSDEKIFNEYRFSRNSIIDKYNKFKIFPYRDLSHEARFNTKKKEDPKKDQEDDIDRFQMNQLKFQDLMNVATGKVTSSALYKKLKFQAKLLQIKQNEQISLRKNQANKSAYIQGQIHQAIQKQQYLQIQLSPHEKYIKKLHILKKQQIKSQLDVCLKLIKNNIHDKKLHKNLTNNIQQKQKQFIDNLQNENNKKYNKMMNQDKWNNNIIKYRKQNKDRVNMIKLQQLRKVYYHKKQFNNHVKDIINYK